jgi:hypothetical protein
MKKQILVLQEDLKPLGPFASVAAAKRAIRDSVQTFLGLEDELETGTHEDLTENYTIVEVLETVAPRIKVTATFSLKAVKPEAEKPLQAPDDWDEEYFPECPLNV